MGDRARLDALLNVMHAQIHKILHNGPPPPHKRDRAGEKPWSAETSADDVLQEALDDLLAYPHEQVTDSFEALGVDIAKKRGV